MSNDAVDFDAATARAIDRTYQTPDIVHQRLRVLDTLCLAPGEAVVDIGAGTGLMAHEMGHLVGPAGQVAGVDRSAAMLHVAAERCADLAQVRFDVGDACALPLPDGSMDAAVSMQVHEYVPDTEAALAEIFRVLKPGGRLSILDTAWDSVVWASDNPALTTRILKTWERHCPHPNLPLVLGPKLRAAGFRVGRAEVIPIFSPRYTDHSYAASMMFMIARYCVDKDGLTQEDVDGWLAGQMAVAARGDWFFSLNRYVFTAVKP
ncbi:MAG: methyltransferase domain-containing protein [Alphaproteobacteria bacterium]